MLRSDGTVAVVPPVVDEPPHAIARIPTTPIIGTTLANLIWFFLLCKWLPVAFFPAVPGRECAGEQALLRGMAETPRPQRALLTQPSLSRVCWCDAPIAFKLLTNPVGLP